MSLHYVGLNPAGLSYFDDGDPRIRLGTWFYSKGGLNTGWTCDGARIYLPATIPAGRTMRAYLIRWVDGQNLPAPGNVNLSGYIRSADIVTDGVAGWRTFNWAPQAFTDWPDNLLFVYYEFLGDGAGDYLYSGTDNSPTASIQSVSLPGLYCAGPGDVNSGARSWFSQSISESTSATQATSGMAVWYGSEVVINDNAGAPNGAATFEHRWTISATGVTPELTVPTGSANFTHVWDVQATGQAVPVPMAIGSAQFRHIWALAATGEAPSLDIPEGSAVFIHRWTITARSLDGDTNLATDSPIRMQIGTYPRDHIRQRATDLMSAAVRISRPGTEYDPVTRRDTSTEGDLIYEGPARIWEVPAGSQIVIGEEEVTVTSTYLSIPFWVHPLPESDDLIVVTQSDDEDLIGRSLDIISVVRGGGLRASRRFQVRVSASRKSSW